MHYDNIRPASPAKPMRYAVSTRYGIREYARKVDAICAAKLEVKDGWPARVRDMWTAITIWRSK